MPDVGHHHSWVETHSLDIGETFGIESLGQLTCEVNVGKFAVAIGPDIGS